MQLHISVDASQYAYRAVVYIRYLHHDFIHCSFVVGKCRLAPTQKKSTSIPRLELQTAVTAVRLKDNCIEELKMKVDNVYFYSDSKTMINYICNNYSSSGFFFAHKILEIEKQRTHTMVLCPFKVKRSRRCNKTCKCPDLQNNCRWFNETKLYTK